MKKEQKQEWVANTLCIPYIISLHDPPYSHTQCMPMSLLCTGLRLPTLPLYAGNRMENPVYAQVQDYEDPSDEPPLYAVELINFD